jgi:multiple sugar transport system substrate-binding protein
MTEDKRAKGVSRRDFIKTATAASLATGFGANIIISGRARAGRKKLKIHTRGHWMPSFDEWFDNIYVKEWGEENNTEVIVDHQTVGMLGIATAEVKAQKGHDLFMFFFVPAAFEEHVIDHREIYQECEKRYSKAIPLAIKSTYNPRTKKYLGFPKSYSPYPISYRKDLWDGIGMYPHTWEDVRIGGAKIKKKYGNPVGIGIGKRGWDSDITLRAIMYSYGASVQDEQRNVVINSKQTLEAVKFVRALYHEAMTPEVLKWVATSNNRFMLAGKGSLTANAPSITREAENMKLDEMSKKIWLAKSPAGPVRRMTPPNSMNVSVIWKFAENIEGAKQFLIDFTGNFRKVLIASEFYDFPCFPDTVPDLKDIISNDPKAEPPAKYKILEDAQEWTANVGYPGYTNAAIDEIFFTGHVLAVMFTKAATGKATPEDAIKEAEAKCKRIFAAWKQKGLV